MVRIIMLAPAVLAVIFISLGISAIARRRGLARLRRMRVNPAVAAPMTTFATQRSGSGRRYIWGVVILLVVLAALTNGMFVRRSEVRWSEMERSWEAAHAQATLMAGQAEHSTLTAKVTSSTRKPRIWFKPEHHESVDTGPKWQASIEQNRFISEQKVNPRMELLSKIADKLKADLRLTMLPPPEFVANPGWVRIIKSETKTLEDPALGELQSSVTEVELTPDGWRELGRLEQGERASNRMEWAARGLGLLTLLFGAIAAFIRLDDWTKGYYSGRLFLLATLIVGGLGILIVHP
jgi:hypothetical protein